MPCAPSPRNAAVFQRGIFRIAGSLASYLLAAGAALALSANAMATPQGASLDAAARRIQDQLQARVGIVVRDTGSGWSWGFNADQHFPMASTFKALACGALLAAMDQAPSLASATALIAASDLVPYSPVTEKWVGQQVALPDLCAATMTTSDNTAANKVLQALGGPMAVTRFVQSLGDGTTRLDRWEPELNEGAPGDPRDTTSPAAIASVLEKLVLGNALSARSRQQLTQWMLDNEVAGPLLRAGIPAGWRIADRTGSGGHGTRAIIAVMWPPQRAPIVVAIFITATQAGLHQRNQAIAELGRVLSQAVIAQ
ncbi:MAG TPA: class A beta-lactamase [Bordetella sp.]|nr:class A beta-lactamase [Bordetella sp.]